MGETTRLHFIGETTRAKQIGGNGLGEKSLLY